jgi:sarcosine oxidase
LSEPDVIVVGLGATGSATLYQLARRGVRVLGLDQFAPPHAMGSTHGDTRITRLAIGEGAHYTPLAVRSHAIWRELEAATGQALLTTNGGLIISGAEGGSIFHGAPFFATTVAAAERHAIPHERLSAAEIRRRYPAFAARDDEVGYFEPGAGFVRPEAAVSAQLQEARRLGATVVTGETVLGFESDASGVTVTTTTGRRRCARLVLSVGPWARQFPGAGVPALTRVYRQVLYWFDVGTAHDRFVPDRFPVFIWDRPGRAIYGFPAVDGPSGGFKIATEQFAEETTPDAVQREVSAAETALMFDQFVAPFFPDAAPVCRRSAVCLYTVTPDFGFVVDRLPGSERVIIASPCSGHGFKHSAAVGELVADLVEDRTNDFDMSTISLSRFPA